MASHPLLGKDHYTVGAHVENAPGRLDELHLDAGEGPANLRRQTGGAGLVVSHHAILNRDLHGSLAAGGGVAYWSNPSPPSGVGKGPVSLLA
jgi:hypothetical protein